MMCYWEIVITQVFFLVAELVQRGVDGVFQGQAQRNYDFRRGMSLGKKEHIVEWEKPSKPSWMDQETYDNYPKKLAVREFKVNGKVYVTTLLDQKAYPKKAVAQLYKLRWQVEINLRSIKSVLGMDRLSCKTPDMVKKEVATHMLGYNVIRIIMADACNKHQAIPNNVSFKGAVQLLNQLTPRISIAHESKKSEIYNTMLSLIVLNKIGNRPGRVEPRMVKQRRKSFPPLNRERKVERERIIKKQKRQQKVKAAAA